MRRGTSRLATRYLQRFQRLPDSLEWPWLRDSPVDLCGVPLSDLLRHKVRLQDVPLRELLREAISLRGASWISLRNARLDLSAVSWADLPGMGVRVWTHGQRYADLPSVPADTPRIPDIHRIVARARSSFGRHSHHGVLHPGFCTGHCRAELVVLLAGPLWAAPYPTAEAAAMVYGVSDPSLERVPQWYDTAAQALADIQACAAGVVV